MFIMIFEEETIRLLHFYSDLLIIHQFLYCFKAFPLIWHVERFIYMREWCIIATHSLYWGFQIQKTLCLK